MDASTAVWAAMDSVWAASAAASAAVWAAMDASAAEAAARDTQKKKLIEILTGDWND
jgi:hypothetical protein